MCWFGFRGKGKAIPIAQDGFSIMGLKELCFVLNVLNFRANRLSQVFKILHTFSYTGSSRTVALAIKLVNISFERSYEVFELLKLLHFDRVLGLKISFLLPI